MIGACSQALYSGIRVNKSNQPHLLLFGLATHVVFGRSADALALTHHNIVGVRPML